MNRHMVVVQVNLRETYILICLMGPYFPNMSYISSAVILKGKFRTNNIRLTSGGSLALDLRPPIGAAIKNI